ncbi:MAG: GIY-YIG nuclease family protein [Chitinophagaceae bacterium]|nr:MAG: GIY-YIG nuclease family protein [Chitinophagaceae bacterium]
MEIIHEYFTYILTDFRKNVLYVGVTNNLKQRIWEHFKQRGESKTFAGRHSTFYLVYYETTKYIRNAIAREKEIKDFNRSKKIDLIKSFNPEMKFLNKEFFGEWPPRYKMDNRFPPG